MKKPTGAIEGVHNSFANWIAGSTQQSRESKGICCSLCGGAGEIEKGSNRDIGEGLMGILCDRVEEAVRNIDAAATDDVKSAEDLQDNTKSNVKLRGSGESAENLRGNGNSFQNLQGTLEVSKSYGKLEKGTTFNGKL